MANVFETSLLTRLTSVSNGTRPQFSDSAFWSDVLISRPDAKPPAVQYTLVTSTGDELVDQSNNQIVAAL